MNRIICYFNTRIYVVYVFLSLSFSGFSQSITVSHILVENRKNPIGVDIPKPKFTWVLASDKQNVKQSAYQIQVSETADFSNKLLWDSQRQSSDQSVHVVYNGPELASLKTYYWRVKVWDQTKKASKWSTNGFWQMALLTAEDWQAKWIAVAQDENYDSKRVPILRTQFNISKEIKTATASITAHGLYEAQLNGKKIGEAYFTPGWTSYKKRLQYQMYDITHQLKKGENALGAKLGEGWYSSPLAWNDNVYGTDLALLLQINVTYTDGTSEVFGTDESWKTTPSEIINSELYNGEFLDSRSAKTGWSIPGYDIGNWSSADVKDFGYANLVATYNEPIRSHETFKPLEVITTPEGDTVLDFGQNLVGFVRVTVTGKAGDTIRLDHAEILTRENNFYTTNLRAAKQQNTYVLDGSGTQTFQPTFTWQGFRYVRLHGIKGKINPDNFTAVALYSDMKQTGTFATSNPLLNQLQHNIEWGQKGNFLDVPTDCPQRDERLGWTGDAQVFASTAAYNMQVDNFFTKWMKDVAADQFENGSVPHVIPHVLRDSESGSAGWSDVSVIVPWEMYLHYGNESILENQYTSMKAWVDYMNAESSNYLWNTGGHFGDWLFYRPDDDTDGRAAITDKYLIAQCFFAHSTQLLINTARVLRKQQDVAEYSALLKNIKEAFLKEYSTPNGRLVSGSQTAYVLALNFDMLPQDLRAQAAKRLAENIQRYNYHLTTGFLGTPYLCKVLTRFGYHDLAYTLLMQKTYPSWLYPVTVGATTIWERWDGRKPDGSFQNPAMNSFNHYAYGAIGDWMYTELAGIKTAETEDGVGYKKIIIKPHLANSYVSDEVKNQNDKETLSEVTASLYTYYGTVKSHWKIGDNSTVLSVSIPVNTTATVHIPFGNDANVKLDKKDIASVKQLNSVEITETETIVSIGSGTYNFIIN